VSFLFEKDQGEQVMKTFRGGVIGAVAAVLALLFVPCARAQEEPAVKPPPLPVHTIEGVGGGGITPMAYLVNPRGDDYVFGKPAASLSYVNLGHKNLDSIAVTETLFGRIELGYAANRFGLGTLPDDIRDRMPFDIRCDDVWLHHFNVRALLVKENTYLGGIALPAITAGVHFKYNDGIADINRRLDSALTGIGYHSDNSEDYTLTATKTFAKGFGRPLIATAGLRLSEAANLGYLGFGDTYRASFEGNVAYLLTDQILLAYEVRQKTSPYGEIPGLIGDEDTWQALDVVLLLNKHTTLAAAWTPLGTLANTDENGGWFLQLKHEF
jgi:hypothetical protein